MNWLWLNGIALLLAISISVSANAGGNYMKVGHTTDTECPAQLTFEEDFVPNPAFTVSPNQALALSGLRCPNKLQVTVFADSENYYITTLGAEPGTTYTRVVNGRTGKTSIIEGN